MSEEDNIMNTETITEQKLETAIILEKMYPRLSGDTDATSYKRLSCSRLEFSATHDPLLMAGLEFWRNAIIETFDMNMITFKNPTDSKSVDRVMKIVQSKTFQDFFLDKAPIHLGMYGRCFGELAMNENWTYFNAIVALRPHDIDFYRKVTGIPVFDEVTGLEEGFVQKSVQKKDEYCIDVYFQNVDTVFEIENKRIDNVSEIRKEAMNEGKKLGLMLCLHWNQINRGDWGYGFIEPVYDDTTIKANMEFSKGETSYKMGHPCPIVYYGNDNYKPDEKMDSKAKLLARDLADAKTDYVALPYFYKIETMSNLLGNISENINKDLLYEASLQASSLGIPLEILMQTGRNNPERLIPFLEIRLKALQRKLRVDDFINLILKLEGYDQHITLGWRELTMQSAKERVMQIFRLGKARLLNLKNNETANRYVMKIAGLPYVEQSYFNSESK